jgi:hypothetical protein
VPGLAILHSKDLVNWEFTSHVIPRLEGAKAYNLKGGAGHVDVAYLHFTDQVPDAPSQASANP